MPRSSRAVKSWVLAAAVVSTLVMGVVAWRQLQADAASERKGSAMSRLDRIKLARPDLSQEGAAALSLRSEQASSHLEEAGVEPEEVADRIAEHRAALVVTEEDLRSFHQARPDLFGDRPFHECRRAVDRLIRIKRTMRSLEEGEL